MKAVLKTIGLIERQLKNFDIPWLDKVASKKDPYKILISCILSLRTKDKVTSQASKRLFKVADTPQKMVKLRPSYIQRLIYPVGFYRNKAKVIYKISKDILEKYKGKVPDDLETLLTFKGVGRKTANLVLGLGYGLPTICVDTHVHRISNRLGWVKTRNPYETEQALKKIIPQDYWIRLNSLLVAFGQNVCLPILPFCSRCYVKGLCPQINVKRWR